MIFDINKSLCEEFSGLDPIKLLDYPAEDVLNLINGLLDYNGRKNKTTNGGKNNAGIIRKKAGDDWF